MADKFIDTNEQLLAQSYDRHLSVNANAGSGKTTVLQKRFVSLLLDETIKVEPRDLIAITFTRKAASEIFAKIAKAIDDIIQDTQISKTQHSKLIRIRERLNSSHISTIHSFCSMMIRDYPIESGVSPNFSELSEAEKIGILKEAITDVLTDVLTANDDNTIKLKHLLSGLGKTRCENYIKKILNKRDILLKIRNLYDTFSDEEINKIAIKGFLDFLNDNYFVTIIQVQKIFDSLGKLTLSNEQFGAILSLNLQLLKIVELIENRNKEINFDFEFKIEDTCQMLMTAKVLTQKLQLNSTTFKKILGTDFENYKSELECFKEFIEVLSCLDNIKIQESSISLSRFLLDLTFRIIELIDYKKSEAGGLDFDDLLIKAQNMLSNKEMAENISKRFRFMMVDEFQDTNEIQYNIIKSLVPQLQDYTLNHQINLFIVGDPKQSIYGFRNADVRVFKKATEDIKNCNRKLVESNLLSKQIQCKDKLVTVDNDLISQGELGLTVSFRHYPVITAFTNRVCNTIMSRFESEYDVEYSNLMCYKKVSELEDFLSKSHDNLNEELFGSVKILLYQKPKKGEENAKPNESEMLAIHIKNLVEGRNYKFSDIAVLSKARTKYHELSNAFQKYDIPYVLHSGKGFYQAQEVLDMVSILKFLHNPGDDLALTAALRSPYFGLNDSQIILISNKKNKTIFENLEKLSLKVKNTEPLIDRAYEILSKLLLYSTRLSIANLIAQIIEICGWYGTTAVSPARAQIAANLNKLKQFAADFGKRGFKTLFDFVEEVNLISKEEINESEAVFITDDNAINVMTIHAAKGLEFPIVALFNSSGGRNNSDTFFIDENFGLSFKSPFYDEKLKIYRHLETPQSVLSKNKNILKEKAELKRLLYVALTRAKEHLIITADLNSRSFKNSLFELILQGLSLEKEFLETSELIFSNDLQTYKNGKIDLTNIKFKVDIIHEVELISSDFKAELTTNTNPEVLMDDIKSERTDEMFSASRIIKFKDDKDEYFSKYILGFEEDFILRQVQYDNLRQVQDDIIDNSQLISDNSIISGAEEGTVIHYLMENINKWYNSGIIDKQIIDSLLENASYIIHKYLNEEFKSRIIQEVKNIISTNLISKNINDILNSKHEAEYNIPLLEDFLNAKIDLLFEKKKEYEVWDWKSNLANSIEDINKLAKHYEFQLKVYAYLVMLLQPERETYSARLLFTKMAKTNAHDEEWTYRFTWKKNELIVFKSELEKYIIQIKSA